MADVQKWTVHFTDPHNGGRNSRQVGGPYSSKQRARNVVDKKDNEYGGYAHQIRPYGEGHDTKALGEGKEYGEK